MTGKRLDTIHVVGGGCQNTLLCQFTADACNRPVLAGPVEATAIGNVLVQALGLRLIGSLAEGRAVVRRSFEVRTYEPRQPAVWDAPYQRFLQLIAEPRVSDRRNTMNDPRWKQMTDFLVGLGTDDVPHSGNNFLAHLIGVYRLMEAKGCNQELCRAGLFHSIYGTELFQGFTLPQGRRADVRDLIGERAERLAYLNCAMDRPTFDQALEDGTAPFRFRDRLTGARWCWTRPISTTCAASTCTIGWSRCRVRHGWDYRRAAYRGMARRLGGVAWRPMMQCLPASVKRKRRRRRSDLV